MAALPAVEHHPERATFSVMVDGEEAYLRYHPAGDGILDYASTFTPDRLRGRRIASALVREALEHARARGCKVIPSCWFVRRYIERHPEFRALVAS